MTQLKKQGVSLQNLIIFLVFALILVLNVANSGDYARDDTAAAGELSSIPFSFSFAPGHAIIRQNQKTL